MADLYENRAHVALKGGKIRIAIHNMHSAVSELEKIVSIPEAAEVVKAYKIKIKEWEHIAEEQNKAKVNAPTSASGSNKEWDTFLEEDDDWKKKNAYDD